ncbi:hypothetical protein [Yeosuana marina]|uniref:hypothetical protein n=1 Tax=Yeosuana marina TaxID=1565536 RepID=UPI0030C7C0E2
MSENRRKRREDNRKEHKNKSDISRKDKIIGILAIIIVLLLGTIAGYYYSLSNAR